MKQTDHTHTGHVRVCRNCPKAAQTAAINARVALYAKGNNILSHLSDQERRKHAAAVLGLRSTR